MDDEESEFEALSCQERSAFLTAKNRDERDRRYETTLGSAQIDDDMELDRRLDREMASIRPSLWDKLGDLWMSLYWTIWDGRHEYKERMREKRRIELIRERGEKRLWRKLHDQD